MEAQFISGSSGDLPWTRIVDAESGLELEMQFHNAHNEVHIFQRWNEDADFKLIGVQEIHAP